MLNKFIEQRVEELAIGSNRLNYKTAPEYLALFGRRVYYISVSIKIFTSAKRQQPRY